MLGGGERDWSGADDDGGARGQSEETAGEHAAAYPGDNGAVKRIFVTRRLVGTALERLVAAYDVDVWEGELPPEPSELRERTADAEGLLCLLTERVDGDLLDAAPRLRVVST